MGFQPGDQTIVIGDYPVTLRLSMGALASISSRLSASGPAALAQALRHMGPDEARVLLACLIVCDSPSSQTISQSAAHLSDEAVGVYVPALCTVFEQSFNARL